MEKKGVSATAAVAAGSGSGERPRRSRYGGQDATPSFIDAVISDVRRQYSGRPFAHHLAGLVANPSMQACVLVRCCQYCPRWAHFLFRTLLIWKHSIDVSPGARIGRGLSLPHPLGIVLGSGCVLGERVTLYQNVTLGASKGQYPSLGDDVTVYPGAVVAGGLHVGVGAVIGALRFVDQDVPPGVRLHGR